MQEDLQKKLTEEGMSIVGGELEIEATIEGISYVTTIMVDSDLNEENIEAIKSRVIEGFKKLHLERRSQGELPVLDDEE